MSTDKRKKKSVEDDSGDPFWSRILIFTIAFIWLALIAGNWIGHYVIKSGILGKKSSAYGSEFKESHSIKAKSWKQPVKILPASPASTGSPSSMKEVKEVDPGTLKVSPSPASSPGVSSPSPSPSPTVRATAEVSPSPSPTVRATVSPSPSVSPSPRSVTPSPSPTPSRSPEVSPSPAATEASRPDAGSYVLQLGNFEKSDNANELVTKLRGKGYSASVVKEGERFKVYIGNYESRDKANDSSGKLKEDGFESFIISN